MIILFVDTPEEATITLNDEILDNIIQQILYRYDGVRAFSSLYIKEDKKKFDTYNVYYAPFAYKKRAPIELVYTADSTGLRL